MEKDEQLKRFVHYHLPLVLPSPESQEGVQVILGVITQYLHQVEGIMQRPSSMDHAFSFLNDLLLRLTPLLRTDAWQAEPRPHLVALSQVEQDYLLHACTWFGGWLQGYRPERAAAFLGFAQQLEEILRERARAQKVVVFQREQHTVKKEIFAFLRMLNLSPICWREVLETLPPQDRTQAMQEELLNQVQAALVIVTPADDADAVSMLGGIEKADLAVRRSSVLFEAGVALSHSWLGRRAILVEVGPKRRRSAFPDLYRIPLSNHLKDRWNVVQRLKQAGCPVAFASNELLREIGDFRFPELKERGGADGR